MWYIIVTIALVYLLYNFNRIYNFLLERYRVHKAASQLPGLERHWILGNLTSVPAERSGIGLKLALELVKMHRSMYVFSMSSLYPAVIIAHPQPARYLFSRTDPKPRLIGAYQLVFPWLGDGLLLSKGEKWKRNRRLLTPAFHFDILKGYFSVYHDCSVKMIKKMSGLAETGEYFEASELASEITLDVMLRCAMSQDWDIIGSGDSHPYLKAVRRMAVLFFYRVMQPWLWFDTLYALTSHGREFKSLCNYVHEVSGGLIKKRRKELQDAADKNDNKKPLRRRLDFLDVLLSARDSNGVGLTDAEIRDEVDTFLFEGHDTSASALSWFLYAMATNPEWQQRCFNEIKAHFDSKGSELNPVLEHQDTNEMVTLNACLKETMRLYSPVPLISRQLENDLELPYEVVFPEIDPDNYRPVFSMGRWFQPIKPSAPKAATFTIPRGSHVDFFLYLIHHNPTVWGDDHMEFRPERFLEADESMDPFAFVPFSAGPRNCIGQTFVQHELRVVASHLLRRFEFFADPERKPELSAEIVMRSVSGVFLKVKQRDESRSS